MKSPKLLVIALGLALGSGVHAFGQTSTGGTQPPPPAPFVRPAIDLTKLPPELQALIAQFQGQRATLLATAQALMTQLRNATPDQRRAILQQFAQDNKAALDNQRMLAKEIRDELKTLRHNRPTGG